MGPEGLQGNKGNWSINKSFYLWFRNSQHGFSTCYLFTFKLCVGEQGLDGVPGLPGPQGENYEVSGYLIHNLNAVVFELSGCK